MIVVWRATLTDEEWDKVTVESLDELCEKLDEFWDKLTGNLDGGMNDEPTTL